MVDGAREELGGRRTRAQRLKGAVTNAPGTRAPATTSLPSSDGSPLMFRLYDKRNSSRINTTSVHVCRVTNYRERIQNI
jgi:hypothetical protein